MEDKAMEKVLIKWADNEKKLKTEIKELKKEVSVLRKLPTPEDFQEQYLKSFNRFIAKLGINKKLINHVSSAGKCQRKEKNPDNCWCMRCVRESSYNIFVDEIGKEASLYLIQTKLKNDGLCKENVGGKE